MEEIGIQELTSEQVEQLCVAAEEAARKHVYSIVPKKNVETLNIAAEVEGTKPVNLAVDVEIILKPASEGIDVQKLADEAVKKAFEAAEKYLREQACHSKK
ncbi:MAG: DUF3194 domain-containing protein [Candidatus Bathyarchaeia archaeon]